VLDKQCNGAAGAYTGVAGVFSTDTPTSHVNLTNTNRYQILRRYIYSLNQTAGATTAWNGTKVNLKMYRKCNIPIEYDSVATDGSLATIRSNNIFVCVDAAINSATTFIGNFRVRYSDK